MRVAILTGCPLISIFAQESNDLVLNSWADSPYMFGDWGGERTKLANRGVALNLIYVDDFLADTKGALANWGRVRGTLDVDLGKAELVQGLKFHITAMWQAGGVLGDYLGTIANPSSNASFNLLRLDSWWFEQALANNKLFVRAGQFAGFDSYGVQQYGESFLMEPSGYAPFNLFAADYEPFAPAGTPAAEVRYVPSAHFYLKSAIFSGNRNPLHDDVSGVHFELKDSPVIASEVGVLVNSSPSLTVKTYPGSYAFGATVNPGQFSNIVTGQKISTNYLMYFTASQRIYRAQAGDDRGLDATFAFDWTPDDITKDFSQITAGVRYHGLIPRRQRDTLAIGSVFSRTSGVLNHALSQAGSPPFGTEKALEVDYTVPVTRWLTFQPVLERYFDIGANPRSRNATIIGFRTVFTL
jgi:porin